MPEQTSQRGRVIGIGGVFFKSANSTDMKSWYAEKLGIAGDEYGVHLPWRDHADPNIERMTVWSVFPGSSTYFDPSPAPFMINYVVDDIEALLTKLAVAGVRIDPKREDCDYGRFAWIYDPDGNKIELWEPPAQKI